MAIEDRNRLRAEAGLPLLDVQAEERRIKAATELAAFETEWARRRSEFADQWVSNPDDGWLSRMARYARARQQVRREMNVASSGATTLVADAWPESVSVQIDDGGNGLTMSKIWKNSQRVCLE